MLTDAECHLIRQQGLFAAADAIFRIFLGLYLFEIGGVRTVVLFFCFRYFAMSLGFVAFGKLLRWFSSVTLMRASMVALGVVSVALILTGKDGVRYAVPLGLLAGLAEGTYWPGMNLSEQNATKSATRNIFFARRTALTLIAGAIAPPLAGTVFAIVTTFGEKYVAYHILFGGLVGVLLVARHQLRQMARWGGSKEKLYSFRKSLRRPRFGEWQLVLMQYFCAGMWGSTLGTFAPILAFSILQSELNVSLLSAVATVVTAAAALAAGRALKRWPSTFWIGVVVVPLGLVLFGLLQTWTGLVAFVLLISVGDMFTFNAACKAAADAIGRSPRGWQNNFHLFVELEAALNLGRIFGFSLILILLSKADELGAVRLGLVGLAPVALLAGLCLYGICRLDKSKMVRCRPPQV